jgi:hypothetical protein
LYKDRTLYYTWQLSFDHVKQRNELSAKLLRLWAYFDNQDIWFELLRHGDSEDPEWICELTEDELSFNGAVRVLSDHGLVEVDTSSQKWAESRGYSIHGCATIFESFETKKKVLMLLSIHPVLSKVCNLIFFSLCYATNIGTIVRLFLAEHASPQI